MKKILTAIALTALSLTGMSQIHFTPDRKLNYAERIIESYYVD